MTTNYDNDEGVLDEGRYVGRQIRKYRRLRDISQQVLADRIGVDRTLITRAETGVRPIDSRRVLYRLAGALSVTIGDLTGHAEDTIAPATAEFAAAVPDIEAALMTAGILDAGRDPRPLPGLIADAVATPAIRMAGDYAALGRMLPDLISDLYRWIDAGGPDADRARRALVDATLATALTTKTLGYQSLAWIAAQACQSAATALGDPVATAGAEFVTAQVLLAQPGAGTAALAHSGGVADRLQSDLAGSEFGLQMYGMLHLHAALTSAAIGRDPSDHLAEARETATRTVSHGDAFALSFGSQNADIWTMSVALEQREGGRALQAARLITPDTIPTADRRGRFHVELGRAHALEGNDGECLSALLRAESIAPQEVRAMTVVRELTGSMLRRARRDLLGGNLGQLADRVGAL